MIRRYTDTEIKIMSQILCLKDTISETIDNEDEPLTVRINLMESLRHIEDALLVLRGY